jgi:energy-coupling factor transporter transmembrane protein EcfT
MCIGNSLSRYANEYVYVFELALVCLLTFLADETADCLTGWLVISLVVYLVACLPGGLLVSCSVKWLSGLLVSCLSG